MHRRTYLRSLGPAALAATAGCLEGDDPPGDAGDPEDEPDGDGPIATGDDLQVETAWPEFAAAYYSIGASPADDPDEEPVPLADLPRQARVEVANAVSRPRYLTSDSPTVLDRDAHQDVVDYRGTPVSIAVAVADRFGEPEHGPEGDPDWRPPVAVEASAADGQLSLSARNQLDEPLAVHHYGRPYFGVLTAVAEDAVPLQHERYADNEHVRAGDPPRTDRVRHAEYRTETLDPDEALVETYGIPDEAGAGAAVWFEVPVGDESVDRLGNRRVSVAASASLPD